jgi:GNAT superfamily N-acetyltransferase
MTIQIREIRPEEYAALGDLTVAAYLTVGAQAYPAYLEFIRDVAARAAACPTLVAVDDGRIIGGVTYVPGPGTPYSEVESEGDAGFRMLAVDPAAQGRGAGRLLVEACIDRARSESRARLVLLTTEPMAAARRLYLQLGFRRAPGLDWRPEPDIELLGFALDLSEPG